jgi:hypothetical protein
MPNDRLSYVHGGSLKPLLDETSGRVFDRAALQFPEREALVVCHRGTRRSEAELKQRVDRLIVDVASDVFSPISPTRCIASSHA